MLLHGTAFASRRRWRGRTPRGVIAHKHHLDLDNLPSIKGHQVYDTSCITGFTSRAYSTHARIVPLNSLYTVHRLGPSALEVAVP